VLPVPEGDGGQIAVSLGHRFGDLMLTGTGRVGHFEGENWAGGSVMAEWEWALRARGTTVTGTVQGALLSDGAPAHERFLAGGRHTLPGYDYRAFAGDRMGLARLEVSQAVFAPWLSLRAFGAAGVTGRSMATPLGWPAATTDGVLTSAGAGIAVGWDVLRLDFGRALQDRGESGWEVVFSVQRRFWPWL